MKLWTVIIALSLVGCSSSPGDRLAVNDELRTDCVGVAGGDPIIAASIAVIEQSRLDGGSFSGAVATVTQSCTFADCITCGVAVVNQVFGI